MIDLLKDEHSRSPEDAITQFLQRERIQALLVRMSERERRVLSLRYGLDDGVSRTLGETAKYFGITRERVRQIEAASIRKLRAMGHLEEHTKPIELGEAARVSERNQPPSPHPSTTAVSTHRKRRRRSLQRHLRRRRSARGTTHRRRAMAHARRSLPTRTPQ